MKGTGGTDSRTIGISHVPRRRVGVNINTNLECDWLSGDKRYPLRRKEGEKVLFRSVRDTCSDGLNLNLKPE